MPRQAVVYDYHDGSLHDAALRAHFERGYEEFKVSKSRISFCTPVDVCHKLLHGSFSSILSNLGQEVLELQLERFFTIFAWKWDPEDGDFRSHLGTSCL